MLRRGVTLYLRKHVQGKSKKNVLQERESGGGIERDEKYIDIKTDKSQYSE